MYYWYFIFLVGAPIKVKKTQSPSPEEIDKIHQQYITALEELFEKHKKNYGICENKHLQICWFKFFIIILNDYVLKVSKFWGLQFYKCKNQWSTLVILYSYHIKSFSYIVNLFMTKLGQSRWLDVSVIPFFSFLRTFSSSGLKKQLIYSHLDFTCGQ